MSGLPFENDWVIVRPQRPPSRSTREVHELLLTHRQSSGISVVRLRFSMQPVTVSVEFLASGVVVFRDSATAPSSIDRFYSKPDSTEAKAVVDQLIHDVGGLLFGLVGPFLVETDVARFVQSCVKERYWAVLHREWADAR